MKTSFLSVTGIAGIEALNAAPIDDALKLGTQLILAIVAVISFIKSLKKEKK